MRQLLLSLIVIALTIVLTGCGAIKKDLKMVSVALTWRGQPATALIASWGTPSADLSATDYAFHSEYDQDILEPSGPPVKPDPPVARVLVYHPTAGTSFKDNTGKESFTIESANTTLYVGVDASGKVLKFSTVTKN